MTTSTLRPNGTLAAFDSLGGGAGSSHAATNDDSDTTYGVTNNLAFSGYSPVVLENGTVSLPSGAVTKQIRVRARVRGDSASTSARAFIQTEEGGPSVAEVVSSSVSSSTITNITGSYVPVTLDQTQVDFLRTNAGINTEGGSSVRFYELYVDLVYVTQPSVAVTAVSPDPYTASTIVPIAWTNTFDSDGGGQTRYEIKVFTDAQYGAGGFDPDTSDPYYTSGIVASSTLTANVGPLEDGDTYRAYVRTAQTVNGALHWSDWDFDEFTMDVATSDVDTVTLAPTDDAGASIVVTVARDAGSQAWELIEVQRSTDAGVTWVDVRGATYVDATGSANSFVVTDYEVGNGVTTAYRARATYLSGGLPITGAWVESTQSTSWTSLECWLKAPDDPTLNTMFVLAERTPYRRGRRSGVFRVLGGAAPVVVSDTRSLSSGVMVIETWDADEAASIKAILDGSSVLLVQFPPDMDIADSYVVVTEDDEQFASKVADVLVREWTLSYVEVDAPADPDAGR